MHKQLHEIGRYGSYTNEIAKIVLISEQQYTLEF